MVVVAAEKTRVVVRAGDDEQLFIVLCALLQHAEQRVGEDLLAFKIRDDAAEKQVRAARGHELLRAQQQRCDVIGLLEETRRAVGVFIAAEDNGQKVLFCFFAAARRRGGMGFVVLGEVFECELDVARVGDEDAAALHRCLLALSGQQDDARVLAVQNCAADALGAVLEHKVRAGNVLFNVGGDLRERLFAGVLLGDEDEVAVLPAQLAEVFSALERVGAGTAEDGDHLAVGVFDLRRAVERVKAHAVVRVVDDDGDVLVAALVDLHAARGARLAKARAHILLRHVEHHTDGHGSEGVGDVEKAGHRDGKFTVVLERGNREVEPVAALFHMLAGDSVALMRAERDEVAAILGVLDDAVCILGVGIDAAEAAGVENFELGIEVVFKIRVLDGADVVAADVQKCSDVVRDTAHAAVFERLGRGLHHKM